MNRRGFMRNASVTGIGACLLPHVLKGESASVRPNVILIYTDQQSASMMSAAGNRWLKTPAMDYLARHGMRFTRAYTTNPVCVPARISMMTGRFPSVFQDGVGKLVRENGRGMRVKEVSEEVSRTTIGAHMGRAGYELIYGGKEHLPGPLRPTAQGFRDITDNQRGELAQVAAACIREKHDRPYFMWLNFINPHDICYMALKQFPETAQDAALVRGGSVEVRTMLEAASIPDGMSQEEFYTSHCPPLPDNHEPQNDEPRAIKKLLDARPFRRKARESATAEQWRRHRWAYCRLTELVDERIQVVLDAVKEAGGEEDTLIVFTSDHGDMDSAHRMEHKTALYEEAANIPFVVMWKGHIPEGKVNDSHLVSNALDLLPTFCDYAGIEGQADPLGRSLRPLLEGRKVEWRRSLGVESEVGRMVVSRDGYKYIRYDFDGAEEQLLDLNKDPGEMRQFVSDPDYRRTLARLRDEYDNVWFPPTR